MVDLRQVIIQAEPAVMFDGRFEEMITNPAAIIEVARQLIRMNSRGTPVASGAKRWELNRDAGILRLERAPSP